MSEPIALQVASTTDLDKKTRREILTLCTAAFGEPFDALFDFLPPDGLHVLARIPREGRGGSQLASHAVATQRTFRVGNGPKMRVAYIDAVATLPGMRGGGLGSRVMRHLMEQSSATHQVGGLNTFIPAWYARMGWQEWAGTFALEDDGKTTPSFPKGSVMVYCFAHTPEFSLDGRLVASWRPGDGW